jgi:hypothetical protein
MSYHRVFYKLIGFIFLGIILIPIAGFLVFKFWTAGGKFNDIPTSDILATAEYIYANSQPTPNIIHYMEINPEHNGICLITDAEVLPYDTFWSRWFMNGERVPYDYYSFFHYGFTTNRHNCLNIFKINTGVHLLEIQFKSSPFDTGISYQFAIKIEPTPTPSPTPSAP